MGTQVRKEAEVRSRLERILNNILHYSHKALTDPEIISLFMSTPAAKHRLP